MAKYLTELVGTFVLVFAVGWTAIGDGADVLGPIVVGVVLMVAVYAGRRLSGAHYNPAVTLAICLRGKLPAAEIGPYWGCQLIAGGAAALTLKTVRAGDVITATSPGIVPGLVIELLLALVLSLVYLATTTSESGNVYYGAAIGLTVTAGMFAVGGITGAVFNPAVALGRAMIGITTWMDFWLFFVAGLVGGAVAGMIFGLFSGREA